jgi:ribosomal-protein-alanine N-acetyltransferase
MKSQPVLLSDGQWLVRSAGIEDAKMISDYFVANKEHLKPWEPTREPNFYERRNWTQRLIKLTELHNLSLGFYLLVIDASTNTMVGTISFSQLARFPIYSCHVGYSLAYNAMGNGIMTTALKLACDYMFQVQHMHRINAAYMPRNKRSESVLQKNGFVMEGFAKEYILINDRWEDHNLTSLVNPNWTPHEE